MCKWYDAGQLKVDTFVKAMSTVEGDAEGDGSIDNILKWGLSEGYVPAHIVERIANSRSARTTRSAVTTHYLSGVDIRRDLRLKRLRTRLGRV